MRLTLLIIVFLCVTGTQSSNFLLILAVGSKSLHGLFLCLAKALTDAGHSVTIVSKYPAGQTPDGISHVSFPGLSQKLRDTNLFGHQFSFQMFPMFVEFVEETSHTLWSNPDILELWTKRNQFDAIITPSYLNEVAFPFLIGFEGVFALFCTPGIEYFSIGSQGNWLSPAVVPNMITGYDENMSFFERIHNFASIVISKLILDIYVHPNFQASVEKHFPHIGDVFRFYDNVSLTLINTHFALESSVPLLPSQIEVGTIAINDPKPLPPDLKEFIDKSGTAGVIYFSIGSFAKSSDIPEKYKLMFIEVFGKLSQRILWKYEGDDLVVPPNVLVKKWLPQQDILGHPKTRLFISHCGNLGTQEAKYHGVPVLAVPVAFDQPRNAARIVRKEYGLVLNWDQMTVQSINETINQIINNPAYKERMTKVQKLLHDQNESPQERAVWWLEYVIRHKGAPHLRYPGKKLHFLQYIMLDVLLIWGLIAVLLFVGLKIVLKRILSIICRVFKRILCKNKIE